MEKVIDIQSFNQVTTYTYLSPTKAFAMAHDLDFNVMEDGIWTLATFIPKLGPLITLGSFFQAWRDAELANDLRAYAENGESCLLKNLDSSYGEWNYTYSWDGVYVDTSVGTSEYIRSFSHD